MIPLTLELTSFGTDEIGSVRKIEQHDSIRLIVTLPREMDEEQANLTAALLLQHLERLPNETIIERVKIAGLHFTNTSVYGIQGFLSAHASTVKHVSIKDVVTGSPDDEIARTQQAFETLASAFEVSSLETLNLSDNHIHASLWKYWAVHRNLRQLILDYVHVTDESIVEFAKQFTFGDHLEELYVVLTNSITRQGQSAANNILRKCRKLSSLRWAEKDAPSNTLLPWNGLYDLACGLASANTSLVHLVMDGGTIKEEELGDEGLCGAISRFHKLRTLKLRSIGLGDDGVQSLVSSIVHAKPPLETLDLGKNKIKTLGSVAISKLNDVDVISRNLVLLVVDRNAIDTGGAREILEGFATANTRLDIKLDGNPFNCGKLAFNLARRKAQADMERDDMRCASQIGSVKDTKHLEDEVRRLRDEKASLLKVLSIVNGANGANELERILDRISKLEKTVLGTSSPVASRGNDGDLGRLLHRTNSSRDIGRSANESASNFSYPISSPAKKSSPRMAAPAQHPLISPTRRSMTTTNTNQFRNTLIRGSSERWSSPMHSKKKTTTIPMPQTSPSPKAVKYMYGHHAKDIVLHPTTAKIDLDVGNRTSHSHGSASDHNQPISRESPGYYHCSDFR